MRLMPEDGDSPHMYFEENTQALLKALPSQQKLIDNLRTVAPATELELMPTPDGNYTLFYKHVFLHDPVSPVEEARNAIKSFETLRPDKIQVIVGIGLGYVVQELFEISGSKIIIFEHDKALLRFVLDNVDMTEYLSSGRVMLATAVDQLQELVKNNTAGDMLVDAVALKSSSVLYPEILARLKEEMTTWYKVHRMDRLTMGRYNQLWVEEMLRNFPHYPKAVDLDGMQDRFKGKPAIVISSGPSVDKAIDAIRELQGSCVLIAVGGVLRRLWQAGITPDFAMYYDTLGMKEQMHGVPQDYLDQIIILNGPFTQTDCFQATGRATMMFMANNMLQTVLWLDKLLERTHVKVPGGSTVSMIGLEIAALVMKCDPVIVVGQDLAFPNNQVYAGGVMVKKEGNMLTLDGSEEHYSDPAPMSTIEGQSGEMLPTLQTYALFAKGLEEMAEHIEKQPNAPRLYNASIGGARLRRFDLKPMSEFVGQFENWKQPFAVTDDELYRSEAEISRRRALLLGGITELREGVQQAISKCKRMQRELFDLMATPKHLLTDQKMFAAMRKLNATFSDVLDSHSMIDYLLMVETMDFKEKFMNKLEVDDVLEEWHKAKRTLLDNTLKMLSENILPLLQEAEDRMLADTAAENASSLEFAGELAG